MTSSGEKSFGGLCHGGHQVPAGTMVCPTCGSRVEPVNGVTWPLSDGTAPPPALATSPGGPLPAPGREHWGLAGDEQEEPPTNGFALASLVLGILWVYWVGAILAVVFGHVALSQIRRSGEKGQGLAIAGLVLGYVWVVFGVVVLVAELVAH